MPGPGFTSDGWFREENEQWPGQAMSLKVHKVLYDAATPCQHLSVFSTDPRGPWGNVMTLDGCIQFTDFDEFVYHEMLGHASLCAHPNPQRVLILGGGDGGVMREVLRHSTVTQCEIVDIDGDVVEMSKKHFPKIAAAMSDPRATVRVGDAAAFVRDAAANSYDVIIIDTTDPAGPASALFGEAFYADVIRILAPNGICCNQGESIWLHRKLIEGMADFLKNKVGFASVKYGLIYIPSYPCGSIGTLMCCKAAGMDATRPARMVEEMPFAKELKYYDSSVHQAAFVLPRFAQHLNKS